MDAKKISFGFSKVTKKLNLQTIKQSAKDENKVELIKCLEGQEIKLVQEKPEEAPLTIPLRENQKTSAALASLIKRRAVLLGEDEEPQAEEQQITENQPATNGVAENLEKRAERELVAELKSNGEEAEETSLVLPIVKADELPLEGAKESTMDDYDSIPVQKFGTAMLRGMGWVEPPKKKGALVDEAPMVRPKGMGLGADKALKAKPLLVAPEPNEVLEIKKQAYVRILGGKHKDLYGQIEGFDDHAGRVIVKMAIGGMKEAFNEFLCQPISKKEFAQYGKCINSAKYEEFKKLENEHGQIIIKREVKDEQPRIKKERSPDDRWRHDRADSDIKFKKEETERKTKSSHSLSEERYERRRGGDESNSRKYPEERSKSTRRHEDLDRNYQSNSKYRDEAKEKRRSRSREAKPHTSSHSRRQQQSASSDSGESSESESDSDSALERKHKKKSSKKSKSKRKSKKSKSKSRHRYHTPPQSEGSDDSLSDDNAERRRSSKNHKKKTKRSKKPRSRSRSRGRR